ncbi:MAG: alpha/beta fold hydrolase [Desulfobacteraceae bacterium]|nr:alpha/beta fold hydrolase [Desulfobacteraceae bacterium]
MKKEIAAGTLTLEARLEIQSPTKGVVITHPHPLYGGDMDNPVVSVIEGAFLEKGFTTLRFNFRGVGTSTGRFDNGRGETRDLGYALDHLKGLGIRETYLAGYSFGAWVITHTRSPEVNRILLVSPPSAFMDFSTANPMDCPVSAVTGSLDELAPPASVTPLMKRLNPKSDLVIMEGADHFYSGFTEELSATVSDLITT